MAFEFPDVIEAADVKSWGIERRSAFMKEHPAEWSQLLQGEDVRLRGASPEASTGTTEEDTTDDEDDPWDDPEWGFARSGDSAPDSDAVGLPDESTFVGLDPDEPGVDTAVTIAKASFRRALKQIAADKFAVTLDDDARNRLADLRTTMEQGDDEAAVLGAWLVRQVQSSIAFNESNVEVTTPRWDPVRKAHVVEQIDNAGKLRTVVLSPESHPEAYAPRAKSWSDEEARQMTPEQVAALSPQDRQRFLRDHPEEYSALLVESSARAKAAR